MICNLCIRPLSKSYPIPHDMQPVIGPCWNIYSYLVFPDKWSALSTGKGLVPIRVTLPTRLYIIQRYKPATMPAWPLSIQTIILGYLSARSLQCSDTDKAVRELSLR